MKVSTGTFFENLYAGRYNRRGGMNSKDGVMYTGYYSGDVEMLVDEKDFLREARRLDKEKAEKPTKNKSKKKSTRKTKKKNEDKSEKKTKKKTKSDEKKREDLMDEAETMEKELDIVFGEGEDKKSSIPKDKNGRFRITHTRVHLTYSYQFDEKKFLKEMRRRIREKTGDQNDVVIYSIVKEYGKRKEEDGEEYPHLHAALRFKMTLRLGGSRFFDYYENPDVTPKQAHCHIRVVHPGRWNYLCETYHTKDGIPYTNHVYSDKAPITYKQLKECKTEKDLMKLLGRRGELAKAGPYLKAMEHCRPTLKKVEAPKEFYAWQTFFIRLIESGLTGKRVIFWIYNEMGSMGKTFLSCYLKTNYNVCVLTTTEVKHAMDAVARHIKRHGAPPMIIIDLPRSGNISGVYELVEKLKSGIATTTKFGSDSLNMPSPHIVVFSNASPNIEELTLDRWCVYIPSYNGEKIDYAFLGAFGQILQNGFERLEMETQIIEESKGNTYVPCLPVKQKLEIEHYKSCLGYLSIKDRQEYWDRGVFPIIRIEIPCLPTNDLISSHSVKIIEEKMSEKELKDYEEWKNGKMGGFSVKALIEAEEKINQQVEKKLAERRAACRAECRMKEYEEEDDKGKGEEDEDEEDE